MEGDWERLSGSMWQRSFFLSWDWIAEWFASWGDAFDLMILLARRRGIVVGIAPLVVRQDSERRLEFIGQNCAFGEYLDFLVPAGLEGAVVPAFARALLRLREQGRWRASCLATMLEASPTLLLLEREWRQRGMTFQRSATRLCRYVDLRSGWDGYRREKGRHFSGRMRYLHRRLSRHGEVKLELARTSAELDSFLDDFERLHARRWIEGMGERHLAFLRRLAKRLLPLGRLLLARLLVGRQVVAVKYDFIFDQKVWGYQGGWLPECSKLEVGSVLLAALLKFCAEQGLEQYDFLDGDAWYKRRWSNSMFRAVDLASETMQPAYQDDRGLLKVETG
jgi:CelD/BcsL family acetyltransferase involved in cellulose biosynthesis